MGTRTVLPRLRLPVVTASAAACIVAFGAQAPASAAADQGGPVTPACAWDESGVTISNQGGLDSAEAQWSLLWTVQDGLRITLSGRYPDSRYTSLDVYGASGLFSTNGVASSLTDYAIQPDRGSVNPWQRTAPYFGRAADAYTVTLQSDVAPGQVNTLPLAPAGTAAGTPGGLIYRVYLPASGNFSQVPLPAVTFTLDGVSERVPDCPAATAGQQAASALSTPARPASTPAQPASSQAQSAAADGVLPFARYTGTGGGYPDADIGYLLGGVVPPGNGDVFVIQGKAPTAAWGEHPSPWPAPGIDMQYWSLCDYLYTPQSPLVANQLPGGTVDYGCRYDSQVRLDWQGDYMFVLGTEAQRAAIERIPGTTFLPFSAADPTTAHILQLRDMVVSTGFAEAVQDVPANGSAAAAAAVMGPYYPRTAICPLATLASDGAAAC
jgi:hypothetical protein